MRHAGRHGPELGFVRAVSRNDQVGMIVAPEHAQDVLQAFDLLQPADKQEIRTAGERRRFGIRRIEIRNEIRNMDDAAFQAARLVQAGGEPAGRDEGIDLADRSFQQRRVPPQLRWTSAMQLASKARRSPRTPRDPASREYASGSAATARAACTA